MNDAQEKWRLKSESTKNTMAMLIILADKENSKTMSINEANLGIRLDRDKLEIRDLKSCYDEIHSLDIETLISNDKDYSGDKKVIDRVKSGLGMNKNFYIGRIKDREYIVDENYIPTVIGNLNMYSWRLELVNHERMS